ncbi:MAG: sodium:solute symporter family protein [Clostridia bacterium]|nr:sodium:solute symporter family protein [Clostridia bacterium]
MNSLTTIWVTVAIYIAFIVGISVVNKKRSKSMTDFAVGGRSAGGWASALSYGTAYFSAVMFIGYSGGTGWKYGLWAVLPGIGNAIIGSLLAWLVLANRTRVVTRNLKIKSMPQFFEKRFSSPVMKMFCMVVVFVFLIPYSASVYKGLTSVCSVLLNVNETACMIVIAIVSLVVVVLGGYAAALKADFIQGIVMIGGVIVLIVSIVRCHQVGGLEAGLAAIREKTQALELGPVQHIALWATVLMTSLGTWGLPQMIHKYYGIRDNKEVKRGTVVSTFFALIVAGGGYFIGSLSRLFYSNLVEGGTDYLVPNMLSQAGLSSVLLGVVLVLLIAASVSTLSSITITASSTITMDFVKPKIFPNFDGVKTAWVSRVISVIFIVLSYLIANSNTPILDMMSYSWGIISGSFLAPYAISLYWKKLNKSGAWAGMIGGFIVALPPVICKLFANDVTLRLFGLDFGYVMDMGAHFACLAMIVSIVLCFVVSAFASKQAQNTENYEKFYSAIEAK